MKTTIYKSYFLLHIIVLIFGFTGVLGEAISLPSERIVWYRVVIAVVSLLVYSAIFKKKILNVTKKQLLQYLVVGFIVALHWITFFYSIKISNVSVALASLSSGALFTSFLEPLINNKKLLWYEVLLGIIIVFGLILIFNFSLQYYLGIIVALVSSFLAAIFGIFNAKFSAENKNSTSITFYEMLGGVVILSLYFLLTNQIDVSFFSLSFNDLILLIILGVVATSFAFVGIVKVLQNVSAFTVALSINLEPVYGILVALYLWPEKEKMHSGFYGGTLVILSALVINAILKKKYSKVG